MSHSAYSAGRVLLVLLLLCATATVQAAPVAPEHEHSSRHCCASCHVGGLHFLQPAIAAAFAPALVVAWVSRPADLDSPREVLIFGGSSRAPPA